MYCIQNTDHNVIKDWHWLNMYSLFYLWLPLVRPSCFVIRRKFLLNHVKTGWEALLKVYTENDIQYCRHSHVTQTDILKQHQSGFFTTKSVIALFVWDIAICIFLRGAIGGIAHSSNWLIFKHLSFFHTYVPCVQTVVECKFLSRVCTTGKVKDWQGNNPK